jgi:glucokinase
MQVLAGDIGGTKTLLALCERTADGLRTLRERSFPSQEHGSFDEIVENFLADGPRGEIGAGCFAVAGPVIDGRVKTTNLPWVMEEGPLARVIGAPKVKLLNDLAGTAFGMLFLADEDRHVLNQGTRKLLDGNVVVIAAGTGLGEAMLYFDGERHHPIASEGGHGDFAPQTDQEVELLKYLRERFGGHVSYERILAGPGLYNLYCFLRDTGFAEEPAELRQALEAAADPSPVISKRGVERSDALCTEALDLFCRIYGAEAGNFAMRFLAVGGVFVGGGIAPKILPALRRGQFMEAYTQKGRFTPLMQSIPVHVCLDPKAALHGAARYGARLL